MVRLFLVLIFFTFSFSALSQKEKSADSLIQVVKTAPDSLKAEIYLDLAVAYRTLDIEKAYQYARIALNTAKEEPVSPTLADAHNILGSIYNILGDFKKANEELHESLKLNELLGRTRGVANAANSLGILYFNQQDYKNALSFYKKAMSLADSSTYRGGYATFSLNIGEVYQVEEKFDLAKPLLEKALKIFVEVGDDEGIAYCNGILAKIDFALGNYNKALENSEKALDYFAIDNNELGRVEYLLFISDIYKAQSIYLKAKKYAEMALSTATDLNSIQWMMKSHESLADLYEYRSIFQKAFYHVDTAKELRTKLFDEQTQQQINNMRIIYETDKVLQENKLLKINSKLDEKTISEQKAISLTIAIFLLAVAIFAYYVYRANKNKQRSNRLLRIQNEEIRQQREEILTQAEGLKEINEEITDKNELIEKKNKDITDSLNYAKRIQSALLPFEDRISKTLSEHFILYKPKDIVSGDFYWFRDFEEKAIIVVADCTGHGIPGAFMSFIGHDLLNYICNIKGVNEPAEILTEMKRSVIRLLRQRKSDNRDGLDVSICVWDKKQNVVSFAGANHSLLYIQDKTLNHIKGDRTTIGMDERIDRGSFQQHDIKVDSDTAFYLYTDGYVDQFGGPKDKKFMVAPFKELLLQNHLKKMTTQKDILKNTLADWQKDQEQIDDILVFGFRLFD